MSAKRLLVQQHYPFLTRLFSHLSNAKSVVSTVRINENPVSVYDKSLTPKTVDNQAGVTKGVKNNKVGGKCYPIDHSGTVRAGKKPIVRHNDKF